MAQIGRQPRSPNGIRSDTVYSTLQIRNVPDYVKSKLGFYASRLGMTQAEVLKHALVALSVVRPEIRDTESKIAKLMQSLSSMNGSAE